MNTSHTNLLIHETSPYLLQHAHNPVDWHPWNDETLALARRQNKMLLVSIGYSACHWCHVMEHESFEDEQVAAVMNRHFVCVKVDREERPDVDQFFMEAVQLISGRGGWPLNCFALPDGRPVWGGTYFRKDQWMSVLQQISQLFESQSPDLFEQADQLTQGIKANHGLTAQINVDSLHANWAVEFTEQLLKQLDYNQGGTQGAPKFPLPDLLMLEAVLSGQVERARFAEHLNLSLIKMAEGGIFDQIGGGFSRYSVDSRWHVPHFEKMLYDNAQLITVYAEAWRQNQNPFFEEVVRKTIDFLQSELSEKTGLFMSALDADSEGEEGKFYVWTKHEWDLILGENAALMADYYGIDEKALWEDGKNVLVRAMDLESLSAKHQMSVQECLQIIEDSSSKLKTARDKRVKPGLDDKCLLSWNALLMTGLVRAAAVFGEKKWFDMAQKINHAISTNLLDGEGDLKRSWKNGQAKINGFLDDYAFYINALFELFQYSAEEKYALQAKKLIAYCFSHFFDEEKQSFTYVRRNSNQLQVETFENHDNVMPSSNASMAMALIKAGMIFEDAHLMAVSRQMIANQMPDMKRFPSSFSHWARALRMLEAQKMVCFTGDDKAAAASMLMGKLSAEVMIVAGSKNDLPVLREKNDVGSLRFYYCDQNGCSLPVANFDALLKIMQTDS